MISLGYAVGAALGIAVLSVLVRRPRWVLFLLIAVAASNASTALGTVGGLSPYLATLGLATLTLAFGVYRGTIRLQAPPVVVLFGVAVASVIPAVVMARDSQLSLAALTETIKDLWFLTVVMLLALSVASAWTVARVVTGVMVALSGLAVLNQFVLGGRTTVAGFATVSDALGVGAVAHRQAGPFIDPNFFGRVLVLAVPLSGALALQAWRGGRRVYAAGWLLGSLLLLTAIFLTGSRGAMLSVALAVGVFASLVGPTIRKRALLALPVVVVVAAFLPGVGSRLASLAQLDNQPTFVERDYSLVERAAVQKVLLSVFLANPALGVGPDNSSLVFPQYSINGGSAISRTAAPHNFYLQLGAESGILGLAGWLVFLGGVLVLGARVVIAHPVAGRGPPTLERVLAAAVIGAVSGWCLASLFLHLNALKSLLLVAAVVACIPLELPPGPTKRARHRLPQSRTVLRTATVLVVTAALLAGLVQLTHRRVWVAQVQVTLVASAERGAAIDPYARSITSRRVIVATYAAVVDRASRTLTRRHPDVKVAVVGSGTEAVLTIRVEGADRAEVRDAAEKAGRRGNRLVRDTASLRALAVTDVGDVRLAPGWTWSLL